jgi:2EXR family
LTSIKASDLVINICKSTARLDTFSVFSDFPVEIRLKIWESALPEPRVVTLMFEHHQREVTEVYLQYHSSDTSFSTVLLDACNESSRVFLKHYQQPIPQGSTGGIYDSEQGTESDFVDPYEL